MMITCFPILLNRLIVPAAAMWVSRSKDMEEPEHAKDLRQSALPWFVIAFIAFAGLRTLGDFAWDGALWQQLLAGSHRASEMLLLCGMAAVGLGITFAHLREAGWRPLTVAFLAASATGATALVLLHF